MTEAAVATELTPTPSEAAQKLNDLGKDEVWREKLLSGDALTRKEFDVLLTAKHESDRVDSALAGTLEPQPFEVMTDGKLSSANLAIAANHLRSLGLPDEPLGAFLKGEPVSKELRAWVDEQERLRLGSPEWRAKYLAGDAAAVQSMTAIKMVKLRSVK